VLVSHLNSEALVIITLTFFLVTQMTVAQSQ